MGLGFVVIFFLISLLPAKGQESEDFWAHAEETLQKIQKFYLVPDGKGLYRENYPDDEHYRADYLGGGEEAKCPRYAYLWPFSGAISAHVALLETERKPKIQTAIEQKLLRALEEYQDKRTPTGYASYLPGNPAPDRFYDDNIWLGIDFAELYRLSKDAKYLHKALDIWRFVMSGTDSKLGGGIYWCEQRKESKNTCSNAPAAVFATLLFDATKDSTYLQQAQSLYDWTRSQLLDPDDGLYWDNVRLDGGVEKTKHAYNTGQMIQAGVLLFQHTGEKRYLEEAHRSAAAGYRYFFEIVNAKDTTAGTNADFPRLRQANLWFISIMFRGYVALYQEDGNAEYVRAFGHNLASAWHAMRDEQGLFGTDWAGRENGGKKWLLNQFAMVEMYARLAALENGDQGGAIIIKK